jgi:hypothetical protein
MSGRRYKPTVETNGKWCHPDGDRTSVSQQEDQVGACEHDYSLCRSCESNIADHRFWHTLHHWCLKASEHLERSPMGVLTRLALNHVHTQQRWHPDAGPDRLNDSQSAGSREPTGAAKVPTG